MMKHALTGQLLIASPQMDDPRFANSVILICEHDADSAMGLIINQKTDDLDLDELATQLDIGTPKCNGDVPIHYGGPVEKSRGTVLHSTDHMIPETVTIGHVAAMTANIRIISEIAGGQGPSEFIIALGHAGWSAGQLEREIKDNCWITMPYAHDLVFSCLSRNQWQDCYSRLGIATEHMSASIGHA